MRDILQTPVSLQTGKPSTSPRSQHCRWYQNSISAVANSTVYTTTNCTTIHSSKGTAHAFVTIAEPWRTLEHVFEAFLHQLVRSADQVQAVDVVEFRSDFSPKQPACSPR